MTALCGGGTSSARPEFGEFVYVAPAALGAFLNNIPTPWAVALAGFIGSMTFRLATFCTSDPPAVPSFTAADVAALINPYDPFTYNNAQSKFQNLIGAYMWHQLCRCDNGTVPSLPNPPAEPTGMPDLNPPAVAPSYPNSLPCDTYDDGVRSFTSTGSGFIATLPIGQVTYVREDIVEPSRTTETVGSIGQGFQFLDSVGNVLGGAACGLSLNSGFISHAEAAVPTGTTRIQYLWQVTGGLSAPFSWHAVYSLYCGTTPTGTGGTVPQPCPTDPFVQGVLEQILALVTLIQRQAAPFAYIAGTVHAGLSGNGHFAVQGLLGAKVSIDTFPSGVGLESGDPDVVWQGGWINWANADGAAAREWISASPLVSLPALAGQYTELHYSLPPGVTVTITELEREP